MTTILLADDDEAGRHAFAVLLRTSGYDVIEANCGNSALEALEEHTPDLLLTDVYMPGVDGVALIERLRNSGSKLPILAITGGGMLSDPNLAADLANLAGADRVLTKPVTNSLLLDEIAGLLSERPEARKA